MRPISFERIDDPAAAVAAMTAVDYSASATEPAARFIGGGTTLVDLMKLDVARPRHLIDVSRLPRIIEFSDSYLRIGGSVRMAEAADHPQIVKEFPIIAQSLQQAASQQIRNMATLAGNVLQRTRCPYFRDVSYSACNKRSPGSGCSALDGFSRMHAVLGVSEDCIAAYPGDFAQALMALDAQVEVLGSKTAKVIPFSQIHHDVAKSPHLETNLKADDLIIAFRIPRSSIARRSLYLKIRDRQSYAFALASAAVCLQVGNGAIKDVRIALGGVAAKPWRALNAEQALIGKVLDDRVATEAAEQAF